MNPLPPPNESEIEARQLGTRIGAAMLVVGCAGAVALVWVLFQFLQAPLEAPFIASLLREMQLQIAADASEIGGLRLLAVVTSVFLYLFGLGMGLRLAVALIGTGGELLKGNDVARLVEALKRRDK